MTQKNYNETAEAILLCVGGNENISFVNHCMTRLRFTIKDNSQVHLEEIKAIPGVLGCQFVGEQLQVIIGPDVEKVYAAVCNIANIQTENNPDNKLRKKLTVSSVGNAVLDTLSGCLTPILPILIVGGLFKMLVSVLGPSMLNVLSETSNLMILFNIAGDGCFYFFPIFVALSGSKKFGCSPMIALLIAGILIHPTIIDIVNAGTDFTVYGIPMTLTNYASTVVPMILITWAMAYVEKLVKKIIPQVVATLFVPFLTVLIMLPVALCILGPLGSILGVYLSKAIIWMRSAFGPFGVAILGSLIVFITATGMHLPLITTAVLSITTLGFDDMILICQPVAMFGCMAIGLSFFIKAPNADDKALGLSCFVAQCFGGVSEPTIFGILFRYKKALFFGMAGNFFGSLYVAFMNCKVYFLGTSNFLNPLIYNGGGDISNFIHGCIGCAISFIVTFGLIVLFGYTETSKERLDI